MKIEVEFLFFDGGSEGPGGVGSVQTDEGVVFEMDGAVRALGQRLAQHLLGARRTGGDDDYFARRASLSGGAPLRSAKASGSLTSYETSSRIQVPDSFSLRRRVFLRHLFHADQNLHASHPKGKQLSINEHLAVSTRHSARKLLELSWVSLIADC